ncbi:unnamed protein product [Coffea canephora]|uniref:OCEL domain-containing protein n=1 Tax=Coffea canephora TaxID=49390 RepID=A0A068TPG2_COFCA|nr:unnamed protein product [Coffea canephora]
MYGGSGKLGRGGGGGRGGGAGAKRNIHSTFHPPPLHRPPSAAAPGGRLSMGGAGAGAGPRNRTASASAGAAAGAASSSSASASAEESFSLVTGNPLNFAMIIRLAPDLVEEIKRVESQGSVARIKFDANANNPAGNVINVGGKDFRFTWSRETGELCDIYEERQSGEDGNGLLVESGGAWRKLNVQRVLDESTKNHVKKLSEEAERKLKSRKAIVLDHGNPSMKSQMKALAAAESNPWRTKGAPFKKRNAEPPPGGPPKSVHKSGLTTTPPLKSRRPASPPSSPPEQSGAPGSPFGSGNIMKGHVNVEDFGSLQATSRTVSSDNDATGKVITSAGRGKPAQKGIKGAQPSDLRSMLISLLRESPSKGMSLKALEKAIGDTIPNSVRQIEPILKKIATFQDSGRYFLKPGVEIEGFKKASSGNQSSPEDSYHQSPAQDDRQAAPDTSFPLRSDANEMDEQAELDFKNEAAHISQEKGVLHHSYLFGDKKVSDNSEGPIGSSSDSGSDSDSESDSSDSGSDSSRSRSRSPAGSGTGSSSDSESDASTNSKEASDEDVDIMTSDDDKQAKYKLQASGLVSSRSPLLWRTSDVEPDHTGSDEKQDGHVSDVIEIEKDMPDDQPAVGMAAASISVPNKEGQKPVEQTTPSLYNHHEDQEREDHMVKIYKETGNMSRDRFNHGQSDSSEKASRGKYKRVSDEKDVENKPDRSKRFKLGNSHQTKVSPSRTTAFENSYQNSSPDRSFEELHKGHNNQMADKIKRDINSGFGSQKSHIHTSLGKSTSDSVQPIQRSADSSARAKPSASVERPGKHSEHLGRSIKHPERLHPMTEGVPVQKDKPNREMQDNYGSISYKGPGKVSKEDLGEKYTATFDSRHRKHEASGSVKDFGSVLNSNPGYPLKDENISARDRSVVNGRPNALQREFSDLELGELREPLPEETPGFRKQLDRKSSFKQLENKSLSSENGNLDSSKAKVGSKMNADSRKSSPLHTNIPFLGSSEGISNRGVHENSAEDLLRTNQRVVQSQQRHQPRVDYADAGTQHNRVVELSGKNRQGEAGRSLDATPEVQGNIPSKGLASVSQEHDAKQGAVPPSRKESRRQKSSTIPDLNDKQKDTSLTGSSDGCQKRRESSSDENSCPYSKYEKDEPELKEPIKDGFQYKEYVEEFQEKYGIYISLNKTLESYREEFLKYGRDLEASKDKDMDRYHDVERQIKESYRHCGARFKRLKKIFLVLHEELQHLKKMIHEFAAPYLKDLKD